MSKCVISQCKRFLVDTEHAMLHNTTQNSSSSIACTASLGFPATVGPPCTSPYLPVPSEMLMLRLLLVLLLLVAAAAVAAVYCGCHCCCCSLRPPAAAVAADIVSCMRRSTSMQEMMCDGFRGRG